jgi:two-component system sensor histidine kinase HydH
MDRNRRNMGPPIINRAPGESDLNKPFFIVVGFDMTEYDHTLGRLRVQIFILSLAMLLVGLAGWFSLSVIQGYRVSQKTLNEIQAFTTLLITSLPVGIIATNQSGRIATWNLAIEKITGIKESDAVGKLPREILHEALAAFFSGKESNPSISTDEREIQITFAGDMYVLLCRLIQIFDREQKYVGAVLLLSDISKVKQLEQKMRESEKLAAIGKMAGGVAHEVRNPLSSIKGLALLLKNKFVAGSKERDTAQLLIQETERMNRTITEMLSFSRPTPLCLQPVDVPRLLEKEIELIQAETLENNIEVSLATKEDLKQIKGDKDRLTQLLMNILLNSIQAMPEGGVITIEAENGGSGEFVQLTISDTGIGMAESVLSQVFYPYFTTKQQGTGIGLAISQKIILDHNGSIAIASQPGKGTVVTMQLPSVDNHDVAV